jgi:aspartate aminotransferase-like enzyme
MAQQIGADVKFATFEFDECIDERKIREAVAEFRPKMITVIHCETPSGVINPLEEIGKIAKEFGALYYVDFVSSACGAPVRVDDWNIDFGLLGTQKALSTPPDLCAVTISQRAWEEIQRVKYVGYDALLPFKNALETKYFPYTHNWHGMAALNLALLKLQKEGMENVFKRHNEVAQYCRERLSRMGIKIYPKDARLCSPTVTAAYIPEGWKWSDFNRELRKHGVVVGGSYGKLDGVVFRLGHMGSQASIALVTQACNALETILTSKK